MPIVSNTATDLKYLSRQDHEQNATIQTRLIT